MAEFNLKQYEINVATVIRNPSPAQLYQEAIRLEPNTAIASSGALIAYSGDKTGRSPKDKRIVKNAASEDNVWWAP